MFKVILQLILLLMPLTFITSAEDTQKKKVIYFTTGYWGDLFDIHNPNVNRDNCLDPMCRLRDKAEQEGFEVRQADPFKPLDDFELLIVFEVFPDQIHALSKYPKEKMILFLWEPPSVLPQNYNPAYHRFFSRVYTWHDGFVDNKKYFKFHYPVFHPMIDNVQPYEAKKLAALISCNKNSTHPDELYSQRRNIIEFFERNHPQDFDLYGKWWPGNIKVYKGPVVRKVDVLKSYRFCIAYENIKGVPGYVTEKIFDCFQAGTVPVYWGAPNIDKYIPGNCYIDREKFKSNEELYAYLKAMGPQEYQTYMNNIAKFTEEAKTGPYSTDYFVDFMLDIFKKSYTESAS